MKNKKGLSAVVTNMIIIFLVVAAIAIVWVVVRGLFEESTENLGGEMDCIDIEINAINIACEETADGGNNGICSVTLKRDAGGKEIAGVKLVFEGSAGEDTYIKDIEGNIAPLGIKTVQGINTGITNISKVSVAVYVYDGSGKPQLCKGASTTEVE